MADHYSLCLLGVMDRLWFHQIILFSSESSTVLIPKTLKQNIPLVTSSLINFPSSLSFAAPEEEEEISSESIPLTLDQLNRENYLSDQENQEEDKVDKDKVVYQKERKTRLNLTTSRARSLPSSPSIKNSRIKNNIRNSTSMRKLKKSMSCRSLGELELEEVKGFMDLGFIFKKEHISPRMISVVPGLGRLGLYKNKPYNTKIINTTEEVPNQENQEEEEKEIIRPYLSEAWLIRRPDSPLLNLRLPRVYAAADMKKHLKFWARTVATVIQRES